MTVKTDIQRLEELRNSMSAIVFSMNQFFRDNQEMHMLTIKAQLRALIATGGPNMKPLLLDLSDQYKIPLHVYTDIAPIVEDVTLLVTDIPMSPSWYIKPFGEKMLFRDWLAKPDYFSPITKGYVNRNKILRQLADGNATHYDEKIGELVTFIAGISYGQPIYNLNNQLITINGINRFLLDIALATCYLADFFLLQRINDVATIESLKASYESQLKAFSFGIPGSRIRIFEGKP